MPSRSLVICLGNPLRGDDAFGLLVYRLLRRLRLPAVYAGQSPENIAHVLRKVEPETVIVVDALLEVGEGLIVSRLSDEPRVLTLSSHYLPLSLLLEAIGFDPRKVLVIGARAEDLSLGKQPSEKIRALAVEAASLVARLLKKAALPHELELIDEGPSLTRNIEDSASVQ